MNIRGYRTVKDYKQIITRNLVAHADQVVGELLHDSSGLASLDTGRVVSNENCLLSSHGNHTFISLLTIDRAVIRFQQEVFDTLEMQPTGLQR